MSRRVFSDVSVHTPEAVAKKNLNGDNKSLMLTQKWYIYQENIHHITVYDKWHHCRNKGEHNCSWWDNTVVLLPAI